MVHMPRFLQVVAVGGLTVLVPMLVFAQQEGTSQQDVEARFVRENRPSSIIQRLATPEEVAHMSVYAASPQASATTGAALRVEGGIVDTLT